MNTSRYRIGIDIGGKFSERTVVVMRREKFLVTTDV
jgi:hypothetical protein